MQPSKYKFVYSNWLNLSFGDYPVANGMHPKVIDWMKQQDKLKTFEEPRNNYYRINDLEQDFQRPYSGVVFRHTSLYFYFKKHYGSCNFVKETDVNINDECIYFLPYEVELKNINYFYSDFPFKVNDENLTYRFRDTLSPHILNLIKIGKVKILIGSLTEPTYSIDTLKFIEKAMLDLGIAKENVICLWGNTENRYNGVIQQTSHASLQQQAEIANRYPITASSLGYYCDYVKPSDLDRNVLRPKKFMSWNRSINRPHRLGIAHLVLKHNLFDDGLFSFLSLSPERHRLVEHLSQLLDEPLEEVKSIVDKIEKMMPLEIDTQILEPWAKDGFQTNENNKKEFYLDAYLHITSETSFQLHHTPFLSEKTFRPILNLQPFLYFGNYRALEEIRRLGFKTFPQHIDESYDLEEDPKKRFQMLEKEWIRFMKMSNQELHEWYYSTTDILLYNQAHFLTLKDFNPLEDLFNKY